MQVKLATIVKGDPKAPFLIATTPRSCGGCYSIPKIAPLYPYIIMLRVKQGGIKYHFLNPGLPNHWGTFYSLGQWPSK